MRLLIVFFLFTGIPLSYSQSFQCGDLLMDIRDGTFYPTVRIGDQCWMAKNLNIGVMVRDHGQTNNGIIEKTCWGNDPLNCGLYGGLYTWYEAMQWANEEGSQGICPEGWHLPTRMDWEELTGFLGIDSAGFKMKVRPEGSPSWDGSNESGFAALAGGGGYEGYFHRRGSWALFWSSTSNQEERAWFTQLDKLWYPEPPKYHNLYIGDYYQKFNGFSVRCIRNINSLPE